MRNGDDRSPPAAATIASAYLATMAFCVRWHTQRSERVVMRSKRRAPLRIVIRRRVRRELRRMPSSAYQRIDDTFVQ